MADTSRSASSVLAASNSPRVVAAATTAAVSGATAAAPAGIAPPTPTSSHAAAASSDEPPPVVREAKLIRRVNPDYPSAAKKEGVQGFVDLRIKVSPAGVVEDATVVGSNPPEVFDKAALAAVRKWKYDPRFVDGLASEADLQVHLDFSPP
jgi:protein TonB